MLLFENCLKIVQSINHFFVDGVVENYNAEAKKFLQDGFLLEHLEI